METRNYSSAVEEPALVERLARIVSCVRVVKPDYTRLAAELEQAVPFDVVGIVLSSHDNMAARIVSCYREGGQWIAAYHQHPFEGSMLQQIKQAAAMEVLVNEYASGLDGLPMESGDALSSYPQLHSTLLAPLIVEGHVLGTLELGSCTAHIYRDHKLQRLVGAVAHVLAAAIDGAQSGGSVEIQDRQRQALKVVSSSLASKMDLPTILNQIVNGIAQSLNVPSAIFMYSRRKEELTLAAQSGLDGRILQELIPDSLPIRVSCIISQTVLRRQPHVSQDILDDGRFTANRALFQALGIRTIFSYPLFTDDIVYGAFLLCSPESGGFTPLKIDILSLFASQATIAIRNGVLLEAAYQRQRFQHMLDEIRSEEPQGEQEELALLRTLRQATKQAFNMSFFELLRFISQYLLTQNDLDVQDVFAHQGQDILDNFEPFLDKRNELALSKGGSQVFERQDPYAETLTVLTQTAESALVHAGKLGEIGRLIEQLKQSADCVNDAWFIIDQQGLCSYMNPAADAFCNMHLDEVDVQYRTPPLTFTQRQQREQPIEQVFGELWVHIRNANEVREYLRGFLRDIPYQQEMRCIIMVDAPSVPQRHDYSPHALEEQPYDRHYQFTRYSLFNTPGQSDLNALQVHDVTQQVHDENNMSTLLSSVSHDLRTPLTTIKIATSGLLQAGVAFDEQDRLEMLEDIEREADQLTILVDALVALSRIKMGALILEKEWCDILEVMHGPLDRLERIIAGHTVAIEVVTKPPLVFIDHVQMEHVFANLIENAIRRSPAQNGVRVRLEIADEGVEALCVRVFDQGEVIPEWEHEHIFQSYSRLRSYGNGLGLAICKGIIEAHQGRIWIETVREPQTGETSTCFVFTLPMYSLRPPTPASGQLPPLPEIGANRYMPSQQYSDDAGEAES